MTEDSGFRLTFLQLEATDGRRATVFFAPGLNVISGPSDTGKTYISQCIDYLLGSSSPPKEIPESEGFVEGFLGIEPAVGPGFTLSRKLSAGGKIGYQINGDKAELLDATHTPGMTNSISYILRSLSGLDGKFVRTNADGKIRELSFRDVARLVIITEGAIIAERSPILGGQRTDETTEKSVFRVLIDGDDDSGVEERVAPKVLRQRRDGQRELLEGMIEKTRREIVNAGGEVGAAAVREASDAAERAVQSASRTLAEIRTEVSTLEEDRNSAWRAMHALRSQAASANEMHRRLVLLQAQYSSDIARLEATAEAGDFLASMTEDRCPVCGSENRHHDPEHASQSADPESVASACRAEAAKLRLLAEDLQDTVMATSAKVEDLGRDEATAQRRLDEIEQRIESEYQPRIDAAVDALRENQARVGRLREVQLLIEREEELSQALARVEAPVKRQPKVEHPRVRRNSLDEFSTLVGEVLTAWNFPDSGRVVWNDADSDILIGGKPRASFGKGVRALTHAAFSLALLRYTDRRGNGHPGFVVLDSPLVVYREPDPAEPQNAYEVKDSFYRSVARDFAGRQVIVLENEDPPAGLDSANVVSFTGGDHGRQGFLPRNSTADGWPNSYTT